MITKGRRLAAKVCLILPIIMHAKLYNPFKEAFDFSCYKPKDAKHSHRTGWFAPNIIREAIELNVNFFFSADSFKIATGLFPAYVAGRMVDKRIQSCFYNPRYHKNCCQLPWWCHDVAKLGISIPIVALGSLTVFGQTEAVRIDCQAAHLFY